MEPTRHLVLDDVTPLEEDEPTIVVERPSYRAVPPSARPPLASDSHRKLTDRLRDSKASMALSRTLQPLAAGLRSPLLIPTIVYALSMVALAVSGIAWHLSRRLPSEPAQRAVASSMPSEISVDATPLAPSASAEATPPAPSTPATRVAPEVGSKPPIDVMRLPVAPQTAAQPAGRSKPIQPATQR
jgi:hypothetical protein